MSYKQKAEEIYNMINSGQLMEAFEKYYAEDVVMQDIGAEAREGKEACREYEKQFVGSIKEVHDGGVHSIAANEDDGVVMIESFMDVTFKDGNRVNMQQVAVQKWNGEHIVEEKFYHQ